MSFLLLYQIDRGIEETQILHSRENVILALTGYFLAVQDWLFTKFAYEAVNPFGTVSTGKTIYAQWSLEEREPFAVGVLTNIALHGGGVKMGAVAY